MASTDDILTAIKNAVTALSTLSSTWLKSDGNLTSATVTTSTLVITGSGRLVSASVTVAGSSAATIYNSQSVALAAADNAMCVIASALGITPIGMVFNKGLVIVPGTGMSLNITYYAGP